MQRVQPGTVRDEAKEQLILRTAAGIPVQARGWSERAPRVLAATGGLLVQHRVWDRFPTIDQA